MLLKILSPLDIFKVPVIFYYDGQTKRSSSLGILLSIVIFGFMVYQFFNSEFILKTAPSVVTQSIETTHADRVDFNKDIPLFFGIVDRATTRKVPFDPAIMDVSISYYNIDNYDLTSFVPITKEIQSCKFEELSLDKEDFDGIEVSKLYCLKNPTFHLEGYQDERFFSYLQILVNPCNNKTSNGSCKSIEEIDSFFYDKIFSATFLNYQIDANNYENPFTTNVFAMVTFLDPKIIKTNVFFAKNTELQTDDGWLFPSKNTKKSTSYDKSTNDFEIRQYQSQPLVKWLFVASKAKTFSIRTYQRLPEALASVASIAQVFIMISFIFTQIATYVSTMKHFLNQFYYFENIKNTKKNKKNKKKQKKQRELDLISMNSRTFKEETNEVFKEKKKNEDVIFEQINIIPKKKIKENEKFELEMTPNINNIVSPKILKEDSFILEKESKNLENQNDLIKDSNQSQNVKKEIKLINDKPITENSKNSQDYSLKFSSWEYIKLLIKKTVLCCLKKTEKEELFIKAEKIFKKEMDIGNITKKIHEIEKMKIILLNQDQMILFDYIIKPIISRNEEIPVNSPTRRNITQNMDRNKQKVLDSLKRCEATQNSDMINKRLVELCALQEI